MPLKLKQKFKHLSPYCTLAVLFLTLAGGFLLQSPLAQARTDNCSQDRSTISDGVRVCQFSNINITTDIYVKGQLGNVVKVGNDGQSSVTFTVKITLNSPADLITNNDKVYFPAWLNPNLAIGGFGATITPKDTSKVCGQTNSSFFGLGSSDVYPKCQSDGKVTGTGSGSYDNIQWANGKQTFAAGSVIYSQDFTIPQSDFARFGITNQVNSTANNSGLNEIEAYPDIGMVYSLSSNDWATSLTGGKSVFVQLYPTTAAAAADSSAPPQCTGSSGSSTTTGGTQANNTNCTDSSQCQSNLCWDNTDGTATCQACASDADCNSNGASGFTCNTSSGVCVTTGSSSSSNAAPACVPAYGGNSSNFQNTADGGSALLGFINKFIGIILGIISEFVYLVFYALLAPLIQAMLSIHTYTDTFVGIIYPAWLVVRNTCNILFIIAIIAIAMGTLFRVESYQYKHLLVQLIIAALLVNFSLVIGQVVLGLADTVQSQFLPNNVEVIRSLGKNLMVQYRASTWNFDFASSGYFSTTVQQLFYVSMSLGSFAVFAAIAVFLVIRMVALWILLMISPIAYVAGILPTTTQYRSMWWSNFIKYAFFTPIMAFFLNIAAYIANLQGSNGVLNQLKVDPASLGTGNFASFVLLVSSNLILLVFLFAALSVSEKMGIYGGSAITEIGKKGLLAPFAATGGLIKAGTGYGLEKLHEKTGWELRPKEWVEGWKHSREENRAKRKALGLGVAYDKGLMFGNPTSFFQRYWNPGTLKRIAQGGDRKGRRLLADAEKKEKEYLANDALAAGDPNKWDNNTRLKKLGEFKHLKDHANHLLAPVDYHSQKEIRGKIDEEKGKVKTKNWHELLSLFQAAVHENEPLRAGGILLKVTETYNENEFINSSSYIENMLAKDSGGWEEMQKRLRKEGKSENEITAAGNEVLHKKGEHFNTKGDGAEDFRNQILQKQLGMGEQVSMQLMSDVSDICEGTNHRVLMRMYGSKGGKLVYKGAEERDQELRAENNKLSAEQMMNMCNRLGGYIEIPSDDYEITGKRYTQITAPQLAYYMEHITDIDPLVRRGRINASQAKAFEENWPEIEASAAKILDNTKLTYNDPRLSDQQQKAVWTVDNAPTPEKVGQPMAEKITAFHAFQLAMEEIVKKGAALNAAKEGTEHAGYTTIDLARNEMPELEKNSYEARKKRDPSARE